MGHLASQSVRQIASKSASQLVSQTDNYSKSVNKTVGGRANAVANLDNQLIDNIKLP